MEGMGMRDVLVVDPETEFLASKMKTGDEWEIYKENVRPLKRGRKVELLNSALRAHQDCRIRKELLEKRRGFIKSIDDYNGDDPLQPWIECIKWVQESFPAGEESSGVVVLYEQCARAFWDSDCYKNDLRYLKVWLEYADHCNDAEVIYAFLDENDIGKKHALFYISYARHMESKDKIKAANEIINRGISSNAQPIKKLEDAFRKFLARSLRRPPIDDEEPDCSMPNRSFGTDLTMGGNARRSMRNQASDKEMAKRVPLGIYQDKNADISSSHPLNDASKKGLGPWKYIGAHIERNKENNPMPSKWTSYKKPGVVAAGREAVATSALIEVYMDEDCKQTAGDLPRPSKAVLGHDERDIRMKEEMLKKHPLHNFPIKRLPR
ncbi:hypothetical protein MLD38_002185 [Melastoma candidum]|uniref:Uncharacterized protein n=1 Tax=Melastoma candidum TaxID=119954 RepID=A0ACB9SF37_9MYRT|nr:hypothetical protein MLD38_002185 [Melastoma candidum]